MPDGYLCYDPPVEVPPVGPLPALENGHVTFGSFNNPAKITAGSSGGVGGNPPPRSDRAVGLKYRGLGDPGVKRRISICLPPMAWGRTAGIVAVEFIFGVPGHVSRGGRGAGPLSLFRQHHDLRGLMDGRAGDHLPWRDLCQPAFAQPPMQRGAVRDGCRQFAGVRATGRFFGMRPAAAGCMLLGRACESGWPPRPFATGSDLRPTWRRSCAMLGTLNGYCSPR